MADEFKQRTFTGDPNPPASASSLLEIVGGSSLTATEVPPTSASDLAIVSPSDTPAAAETEQTYWVRNDPKSKVKRIFFGVPGGEAAEIGSTDNPDVDTVLSQEGKKDAFGNWTINQELADSLRTGNPGFPKTLAQQYQAGEATVVRGGWGSKYLRGEVSLATAREHGDIERQKMLKNERPDIAWSEAPFGRMVAEARWVAGATANLVPFMKGAATESAGGAAILGGAALAIVGTGGIAAPTAIPLVSGMMATGGAYRAFTYTMDVEGGNIALDLAEKGFSEKTIKNVAPAAGAMIGAMELVGFRFLTAPMKRAVMKNVLMSGPVKSAMSKWYMNYAKELGAEVSVEVAQEVITQMGTNVAATLEDKPELAVSKEDLWEAMTETAIQAAAGMAVIKLPGVAMDYAGSRQTKAGVRTVKAQIAEGELDAKTATVAKIEGVINPEIDASKLNEILKTPEKAEAFGKRNAGNEDVKAALHAKSEALKIKMDAVLEGGKSASSLTPEAQNEVVKLSEQMNILNTIGEGMDASVKVEPMVPVKEPRTVAEAVERHFTEQAAVLKKLDRESKALESERADVEAEIAERINDQRPTAALDATASRLTQKIMANDTLALEIRNTPAILSETLADKLSEGEVEGIVSAANIVRTERDAEERIAAAKESFFKHGAAYAKREVARVQAYIQELVNRSNVTAADKAKFIAVLRNTKTIEQLEKNYPEIRDRIFVAEEKRRAKASEQILKKALKAGKTAVKDGKQTGKFGDADTQGIVDAINKINKMTRSDAQIEEVAAEKELETAGDIGAEDYNAVAHAKAEYRLRAARFRSGQMSTEDGASFVGDLVAMMSGARAKFLEQRLAEKEARAALHKTIIHEVLGSMAETLAPDWYRKGIASGELVRGISLPRNVLGLIEESFSDLASLGQLLGRLSQKKTGTSEIEKLLSTSELATKSNGLKAAWWAKLDAAAEKAYGLSEGSGPKKWMKLRKMASRLLERRDLGEFTDAGGLKYRLDFSIDEAIKRYLEKQDPTLSENFSNAKALAYTEKMEAAIFGLLTDADIKFANAQLELYTSYYKVVNATYRKVRGVDLPFNSKYSPIRVRGYADKGGNSVNVDGEDQLNSKTTAGSFTITRVRHLKPLEQTSSRLAFNGHVLKGAHYVAFEERVREWNALLGNPEFKAAVVGMYGDGVYRAMRQMVETTTSNSRGMAILRGFDRFITRIAVAKIIGKPIATMKQLTTVFAFLEPVPFHHWPLWLKEYGKIVKNLKAPKEWSSSDFVVSREHEQTPELQALEEQAKAGGKVNVQEIINKLGFFIQMGDVGSIRVGGGATFAYLKSQGVSTEEALATTTKIAATTQSFGHTSALSVLQAQKGAWRLMTMFTNQPVQLMRKEIGALRDLTASGRITKAEAAKTLFLYHFVMPMLFQAVIDWGWDDENQLRAATFGSFNSIPIFGEAFLNLYSKLMEDSNVPQGGKDLWDAWTSDMVKGITALTEARDLEDLVDALVLLSDPVMAAAWGIPTKPFIHLAESVKTIAEDPEDWGRALKLAAGFSPYAIDKQEQRE